MQPEPKQPDLIVCMRAADLDRALAPQGTTYIKKCHRCGVKVALSPSSQRVLAAGAGFAPICHVCYAQDALPSDIPTSAVSILRKPS